MSLDRTPISDFFIAPRKNWKPLNSVQIAGLQAFKQMVETGELEYESIVCPCCSGTSYRLLSQADKYGLDQDVVICKECGFVYNNPRLTEKSYAKFYDTVYRQIYMGYERPADEHFQEQYEGRGKRYARYIQGQLNYDYSGKFVVEIGCGPGGILHRFRELGADVLGFDYDSRYVEFGRQKYDLNLVVGDYQTYDFKSSPDIVILGHVLEHLVDYKPKLKSIRGTMAKGDSVLLIEVPSLFGRRLGWLLQMAHVNYFTPNTLAYSLQSLGFEVRVLDTASYPTNILCLAGLPTDISMKPISLDSEYSQVLSFLTEREKAGLGSLDYYVRYRWYYPLVQYGSLLVKAVQNPKNAMSKLLSIFRAQADDFRPRG
ncbi:MAG: hypothetical protein DRI81_02970 [Chloroflexi bacterium]|nr:MAG: hypothetical protein DRI81_02970 [Chloroflexota bacterium]